MIHSRVLRQYPRENLDQPHESNESYSYPALEGTSSHDQDKQLLNLTHFNDNDAFSSRVSLSPNVNVPPSFHDTSLGSAITPRVSVPPTSPSTSKIYGLWNELTTIASTPLDTVRSIMRKPPSSTDADIDNHDVDPLSPRFSTISGSSASIEKNVCSDHPLKPSQFIHFSFSVNTLVSDLAWKQIFCSWWFASLVLTGFFLLFQFVLFSRNLPRSHRFPNLNTTTGPDIVELASFILLPKRFRSSQLISLLHSIPPVNNQNDPSRSSPPMASSLELKPNDNRDESTALPVLPTISKTTLRQFLQDNRGFVLALAPAFFGYYGYFGALLAWEEHLFNEVPTKMSTNINNNISSSSSNNNNTYDNFNLFRNRLLGATGASAGAMGAILLGAGISARQAVDFCTTVTLDQFADFPGLLSLFRGRAFENIMEQFLLEMKLLHGPRPHETSWQTHPLVEAQGLRFETDAVIPVAVTAYDLHSMSGRVLNRGSMARAARASATFPFLFQPVGWRYPTQSMTANVTVNDSSTAHARDRLLIDGGIADIHGVRGLSSVFNDIHTASNGKIQEYRVVNVMIGEFMGTNPPGPDNIANSTEVLSISIQNLPQCGPWAMSKGTIAVDAAYKAMKAALDIPLMVGPGNGHFELHLDASYFWKK
jgi:predicted acylesterase/phospholipase RssA